MDVTQQLNIADLYSAKGLVAVVSGGGSGIGLAYASALAQTSAKKIYILGRRLNYLQEAAKSIDSNGGSVVPVQCDVTDQEAIKRVVKQVEEEIGYVDVLINNSGIDGPKNTGIYEVDSVEELQKALLNDWDKWPATFATNVTAVCGMSAQFLPLLEKGNKRRGWQSGRLKPDEKRSRDMSTAAEDIEERDLRTSQIITTTSISAFNRHVTAGVAYTATKAGATMLGKAMATFLAPFGIRSNVIAPGIYPSEMTLHRPATFPWDQIPAGRQGTFEEISGSLLHLVGKSGAYTNGLVVVTDGGRLSVHEGTY